MERELILERTRAGLCPTEGNDGVGENSTLKGSAAAQMEKDLPEDLRADGYTAAGGT
jgi:hypothetical protein